MAKKKTSGDHWIVYCDGDWIEQYDTLTEAMKAAEDYADGCDASEDEIEIEIRKESVHKRGVVKNQLVWK